MLARHLDARIQAKETATPHQAFNNFRAIAWLTLDSLGICMRFVGLLLLSIIFSGCATHGQEHHFEKDPTAVSDSVSRVNQNGRATVYYFRENAFMQQTIAAPMPPLYYGVDGKLVSIMPVGSYVVLSLEPGSHRFTRVFVADDFFTGRVVRRVDIDLTLESDKSYYIGSVNSLLGPHFRQLKMIEGKTIIDNGELAKLLHSPESVEEFISRVSSRESKKSRTGQSSSTTATSSALQDALPSSRQVVSFLEGLATVAFVALIVAAAVVGGGAQGISAPVPPPLTVPAPQENIAYRVQPTRVDMAPTWRTSSGSLSEIIQSKERMIVRNLSTGVNYEIEDGRIKGSDGSRYRVYGQNVFSDTGQTYQVIGNTMFTTDGRSCTKTGIIVSCN